MQINKKEDFITDTTEIQRLLLKNFYFSKLENLEVDEFLDTYYLPKLNGCLMSNKTEAEIVF
jgi:hypothetical protein